MYLCPAILRFLNEINFSDGNDMDFSDTTIYLPDSQTISINIEQPYITPPYYENVSNVLGINLSIFNNDNRISDFNLSNTYQDNELAIQIQQTASYYSNALAPMIHNLRIIHNLNNVLF